MDEFVFYQAYYEALKELSDESRLKVYDALCDYAFKHIEPDLKGESKAVFVLIKREIGDNVPTIPNQGKNQSLDRIEERSEYMKNYMREYRAKQKRIVNSKVNSKINSKVNSKVNEVTKEIPLKESPLKEKERNKEKRNIYPQEIIPLTVRPNTHTRAGNGRTDTKDDTDKAQREFFMLYPRILIDNYSPSDYAGIDFELLIRRFEESAFLRTRESFSWICSNYRKIASGGYKDFSIERKPNDSEDMGYNGWNFFKRISEQLKAKEAQKVNDG